MTKCYLLGAGASFGYTDNLPSELCPPLGDQFLLKGRNFGVLNADDFPRLCEEIQDYIGTTKPIHAISPTNLSIDIEKLLHTIIDQNHRRSHTALGESFFFIYELLRIYNMLYDSKYNNYRKLALHFYEERFNVISLNYDTLFEIAVEQTGLEIDYTLSSNPPLQRVPIAKIHGSINWMNYIHQFPIGVGKVAPSKVFPHIYSNQFYDRILDVYSPQEISNVPYDRLFGPETRVNEVAIVPPFLDYKDYQKVEYYEQIWNSAAKMIQNMSELVIIGCRLRKEDTQLLNLLDRHLQPNTNVTVVAGGETQNVGKKIRTLARNPIINTSYQYFSEYAADL